MQRSSFLTKPMSSTYMSSVDQIVLQIKLPQGSFPTGLPKWLSGEESACQCRSANADISHTSKVMLKILQARLQ